MSWSLIVATLLLFAVVGAMVWVVSVYNALVRMRNAIDQS